MMIISFEKKYLNEVKDFTDQWIGENYYSMEELEKVISFSKQDGLNASLLAFVDNELAAVRLTYAPGVWVDSQRGVTPLKWDLPKERVSYFKSLFVAEKFQQKGLGRELSKKSIEIIKQMGAQAVVCHSWLESPGNSSQKYLLKMDFKPVHTHERYWYEIDYLCTRCNPNRCVCTAVEMIKYF